MGCNKKPIQGLRFKCKDCPDYDLCAECFANKSSIHRGENAAREFETITFPQASCAWPAFCKGKGKGKCKGKGKGKGKWWFQGSEETPESADCLRPCAREGCKFAATWHATHCCGACANNKGVHGGRCERKVIETATEEAPSAEPAPELKPEPTPEPTAELTQDPSPEPTTEPKQAATIQSKHRCEHVLAKDASLQPLGILLIAAQLVPTRVRMEAAASARSLKARRLKRQQCTHKTRLMMSWRRLQSTLRKWGWVHWT